MTTVAVRHRVTDYGKWRAIFDEHGAARAANAQAFLDDPSLKEAMSQAGLAGPPRVEVYEEAGA